MLKTGCDAYPQRKLSWGEHGLRGTRRLPTRCSPAAQRQAARIVGHILPSTGRLQPPSVLRINRKQRFFYFPILSPSPWFASVSVSLEDGGGKEETMDGGMVL